MKTLIRSVILLSTVAINVALTASLVSANEVMKDRCSSDVAFVQKYDDKPDTPGTIVLTRGATTDWTPAFKVEIKDAGHIRWWCHSTTLNVLDPGTWRPEFDTAKSVACVAGGVAVILDPNSEAGKEGIKQCKGAVKTIGSSAWEGWTPERSRCRNRSTKIRARLDSNRVLQIECLGD